MSVCLSAGMYPYIVHGQTNYLCADYANNSLQVLDGDPGMLLEVDSSEGSKFLSVQHAQVCMSTPGVTCILYTVYSTTKTVVKILAIFLF